MKNIFIKVCVFLNLVFLALSLILYPIAWIGYKLGRDLRKEMQNEEVCRIGKTLSYWYKCYQCAKKRG